MNDARLAELKAEIRQLPKNPPPSVPYGERRQLVADLVEEIQFLRQQRYSFSAISGLLAEKTGILISHTTLRRYFFEELAKFRANKSTGQKRRKASPSRFQFRSSQAKPSDETIAAEPKPKKVKAKADKTPAEPEETSVTTEVSDDDWGVGWNDDDDDSYTTGLINEPTFNRIRRS